MKNLLKIAGLLLWQIPLVFSSLPTHVDWRDSLETVQRIKNQGSCGSCYAFSAIASLEAAYEIKGKKIDLSEQQIVDCSKGFGSNNEDNERGSINEVNNGCRGGWMSNVFEFIQEKGIDSEKKYPYKGFESSSCRDKKRHLCKPVLSYVNLESEAEIKRAVSELGPVSVVIEVGPEFYSYPGGIYDNPGCGTSTDHAVTVVGYGTENGKDYWIIKNSWGTTWGDQGYMKMVRGKNMCGIGNIGSIPILKCRLCVPSCRKDEH